MFPFETILFKLCDHDFLIEYRNLFKTKIVEKSNNK